MVGSSILINRQQALRSTRYRTIKVAQLNKWRTFMFMHHRWRNFSRPPPPPPPPHSPNSDKYPKTPKDQHGHSNHEQFPNFPWLSDHFKDFHHQRKTAADVYTWYANQLRSAHMYKGFTMPSGSAFNPKRFSGWWAAYRDILERCKAQYPEAFDGEARSHDNRTMDARMKREDELKKAEIMRETIKKRMAEKRENIRKVRSVMWEKAAEEVEDHWPPIREKSTAKSPSDTRHASENYAATVNATQLSDEDTEIDLITLKRVPKKANVGATNKEAKKGIHPSSVTLPPLEAASGSETTTTQFEAGEPMANEAVRDVKEPSGGKNFWKSFGRPLTNVYDNFIPKTSETEKALQTKPAIPNEDTITNVAEHSPANVIDKAEATQFEAKQGQLDSSTSDIPQAQATNQSDSEFISMKNEAELSEPNEVDPKLLEKEEILKRKALKAEAKFKAKYASLASDPPNKDAKYAAERERKISSLKRKAAKKQADYDTKLLMSQLYRDAKARDRVRSLLSDENVEGHKDLGSAKEESGNESDDVQVPDHVSKVTESKTTSTPRVITTKSDYIPSKSTYSAEVNEEPGPRKVLLKGEESADEYAAKGENVTGLSSSIENMATTGVKADENDTSKLIHEPLNPEEAFAGLSTPKLTETLNRLEQDADAYNQALRDLEAFILKLKEDAASARTNNVQNTNLTHATLENPADNIASKANEVSTGPAESVELGEGEEFNKFSQHPILRLSPSEMIAYLRYVEKSRGKLPDEEPMPPELLEYIKRQQKAKSDSRATTITTSSFEDWAKNDQQQKKQEEEKSQKSSSWPMHKRAFWTGLYVAACTYAIGVGAKLVVDKPEPAVAPITAVTADAASTTDISTRTETPVEAEKYSMDVKGSKKSSWW